jgi:hypothetical protein
VENALQAGAEVLPQPARARAAARQRGGLCCFVKPSERKNHPYVRAAAWAVTGEHFNGEGANQRQSAACLGDRVRERCLGCLLEAGSVVLDEQRWTRIAPVHMERPDAAPVTYDVCEQLAEDEFRGSYVGVGRRITQ